MKIAVLVTCYNRKATTIAGLTHLVEALSKVPDLETTYVIVDDGSSDGTGAEIMHRFPYMTVVYGDGNLFWNGGMCRAFEAARPLGTFDAYLLFNDDVLVNPEAVDAFFAEYRDLNAERPAILVAAALGADGKLNYSGMKRLSWGRPLAIARLEPNGAPQPCDTFNGNFVLVPAPFFDRIGGLDPRFRHGYGDLDLGYRAIKSGVEVWLAGTPIGLCEAAPPLPQVNSKRERRMQRLRSRWLKRDSLGERIHFTLRHAPAPMAIGLIACATIMRMRLKLAERIS